ncbi:MAG: hypothetical protein JWQ21_3693 [Herminiimonas sp.]|nr:hypothetical protein [Herminiimonas sp.]
MKLSRSSIAIAASLCFHAGMIAIVTMGLSSRPEKPVEPLPVPVELLPAQKIDTSPAPLPVAEVKSQPVKKPVQPKPRTVPKPVAPSDKPRKQVPTEAPSVAAPAPQQPTPVASAPPAPAPPAAAPSPPVRTGVSIPASYAASNRKPEQPPLSRRYGEQGTVTLRVLVKADGAAGAVEIKSSSGYPLLDEAAKSTVQSWRFNPATSDGKPMADWYLVPITFKLQN